MQASDVQIWEARDTSPTIAASAPGKGPGDVALGGGDYDGDL